MKRFTVQFWRKHDEPTQLLEEVRQRYRDTPAFARLLHAAVSTKLHGGKVTVEGKPNAQRVLEHVLSKLLENEQADVPTEAVGKWQYLELAAHPYTQRRVWHKVSRARAWAHTLDTGIADLPFTLTYVLGYPADITRAQAARIEKAHAPRHFVLVEQLEDHRDTAYDLNPNDNEHFRDDRGAYDEAGVLQSWQSREQACWETAYQTRQEAWNGIHDHEAADTTQLGGHCYPARMWSKAYRRIDWHGAMQLLELRHDQTACRRALEDLRHRQELAPRRPADGSWWTMSDRERTALSSAAAARRQTLEADDAEVWFSAPLDVPQTDVELLEEQLGSCPAKAPKGLVATLAHERLAAQRRAEQVGQQREGLAALEQTLVA